jgi:hypothetical protein
MKPDWKWGTPEGSREFDRLMDRRLTFREMLQWQEQAEDLSLTFQAQRRPSGESTSLTMNDVPPSQQK